MKKGLISPMVIIFILLSASFGTLCKGTSVSTEKELWIEHELINKKESIHNSRNIIENSLNQNDEGWFFYPPLSNYAPKGMPDFDQKQNNWKDPNTQGWVFCGAVAFANVLWYLDCMYSDPTGYPGDGVDICPIVADYNAPGEPNPGPNSDDHNFNNVNDPESHWDREEMIIGNELIEKAAWYCDTQGIRTGEDRIGTCAPNMHHGANLWFQDCGLEGYFEIINYTADLPLDHLDDPDNYINENLRFERISDHVKKGHLVNIIIKTYRSNGNFVTGHFVTIAGINTETKAIAFCDPYRDMEDYYSPIAHNDASLISHDMYYIINASPSFEIDDFAGWSTFTTLVDAAVIIIPPENGLPLQPYKPIKPVGPSSVKKDQEYEYTTSTTHPLNNDLYYLFDWGDGFNSGWIGPYNSGEECHSIHSWNMRDSYEIRVKAKDSNDIESPWSDPLSITISKNSIIDFLDWFFSTNHDNKFLEFIFRSV